MKRALIIFAVFASSTYFTIRLVNEPLPQGESGEMADLLANKMLNALNKQAFDSAETLSWTYQRGEHHYVWNKKVDSVKVTWEDYVVNFHTKTLNGHVQQGNIRLSGEASEIALKAAWEFFANDSFWLVAPYKIFDPGTARQVVVLDDVQGLLVTYSSGGVTPGDSYLWLLDENNFPTGWKMWTQKVPIQGVEFSWENWKQYQGIWIAQKHEWLISVDVSNISVQ